MTTNGVVAEFVAAGRAAHALLCLDTVAVTRVTRGSLNVSTGLYATTSADVYSGPARIKRVMAGDSVAGDVERQVARIVLEIPYGTTGADDLASGDVVTVTASNDSALVDKTLTVVGPEHGTTTTIRRYTVEEVSP